MLAFCLVLLYNLFFVSQIQLLQINCQDIGGSLSNEDYARYGEAESEHAQILN